MQRRSTRDIVINLLKLFGAILAIHVGARLFYAGMVSSWSGNSFIEEAWSFGEGRMDLVGWVVIHFAGAFLAGLMFFAIFGLVKLFKSIFFKPEADPNECRNRKCRCTEHRGMVFDDDERRWYYDDSDVTTAVIAGAAAGAIAGTIVSGS